MNRIKSPTEEEKAIAKWLTEGFSDKSKKKSHLADLCDVTRQAVGDWSKYGKVDKRHFRKISAYLDRPIPDKVFGAEFTERKGTTSSELRAGKTNSSLQVIRKNLRQDIPVGLNLGHIDSWDSSTPLDDDEVELPFFMDVELAAGAGSELTQENHGPKLRFSKSTLRNCGVDPSNAACVKISGNSMEPRLLDGDVVGVNLGDKRVVDGKTYAINHDGLLRIKRLYMLPGGGLRINSFNGSEHPDEILKLGNRELVNIIGRVFWSSSIWN
jgi:phage repressor protein C with HTH and peptisase S24 domain